jgi:hypothetical protein|tara:strand:+ start:1846 stop:2262 length:417 start_codon:yes stop_codon:yes gene_type:complete
MGKLTLELEYDFDFLLIGVSCHVPDYRLSWSLNKRFDIDLERLKDVDLQLDKKTQGFFSFYSCDNQDDHTSVNLISNRCSSGYLIPEMKQMDYFIQYWGPFSDEEFNEFNQQIRGLSVVLTSLVVDPLELKSRHNLLF